jgi:hypothetical protein
MKLIEAWKTSNGIYLNRETASLKCNADRDLDLEEYYRNGKKYYKSPTIVFMFKIEGKYFLLNNVPVVSSGPLG